MDNWQAVWYSRAHNGGSHAIQVENAMKPKRKINIAAEIKAIENCIDALADSGNHMVIAVGSAIREENFSYTVGLAERGWPEIIITCIDQDTARGVINGIVAFYKNSATFPTAGAIFPPGFPMPFEAIEVEAHDAPEHLTMASQRLTRLGKDPGDLRVLQLVYSDTVGRFQWEEGFDQNWRQVLLGNPPLPHRPQ